MLFAYLYYKLLVKDLIGNDARGFLGIAAFIELIIELFMLYSLFAK